MITARQLRTWRERIRRARHERDMAKSDVECLDAYELVEAVLDEMHEAELDMTREEVRRETA